MIQKLDDFVKKKWMICKIDIPSEINSPLAISRAPNTLYRSNNVDLNSLNFSILEQSGYFIVKRKTNVYVPVSVSQQLYSDFSSSCPYPGGDNFVT